MRVHVDRRDPLAVDDHGLAPGAEVGVFVRTLRIRGVEQAAAAKDQAGRGSTFDEVPASRHRASPFNASGFWIFRGSAAATAATTAAHGTSDNAQRSAGNIRMQRRRFLADRKGGPFPLLPRYVVHGP
jgi:hypothetical protein